MTPVVVIGIAGGTCSGKTTLAQAICERLGLHNCEVLAMDNFYKQQPEEILASGAANFDCPDSIDLEKFHLVVDSLRKGAEVRVPKYDRKTSRIQGSTILTPPRVLIVEGLFVLVDKRVVESLDLAIFLEVAPAVSLLRRLERDVVGYGMTSDQVQQGYERYAKPAYTEFVAPTKASAELVLSGTEKIEELVAQVMSHLSRTDASELITAWDADSQ